MITINNLTKKYSDNKENEIVALNNISLTFPDKGLVAVIGTSGCGKTTLLNLLSGFDEPTKGTIEVNGKDIFTFSEQEWDEYRSGQIGFVFQNYNLLEDFSVIENIQLPLVMEGKTREQVLDVVDKVATELEIDDLLEKNVKHLSGGQKQRVALVRAIIKSPAIVLADEPTGNLDSENSETIFKLLKQIASKCLVIVVTHDCNLAEKYADRIVGLSYGVIQFDKEKIREKQSADLSIELMDYPQYDTDTFFGMAWKNESALPMSLCLRMAGQLVKKRIIRAILTVIILTLTMSFILFGVSLLGKNRIVPLKQVLNLSNETLIRLAEPIGIQYRAFSSAETDKLFVSKDFEEKIIAADLEENVIKEFVFSSSMITVDDDDLFYDENETWVQTASTFLLKKIIQYGNLPLNDNEILINQSLADKLKCTERDLPFEIKDIYLGCTYRVVGLTCNIIEKENIETEYKSVIWVSDNCFNTRAYCYPRSIKGLDIVSAKNASQLANYPSSFGRCSESNLVYGRLPQNKTEFAISKKQFDYLGIEWESIENKSYTYSNLYEEDFGNVFFDAVNMCDICSPNMKLVGVIDEQSDYYFEDSVYTDIEKQLPELLCRRYIYVKKSDSNMLAIKIEKAGLIIDENTMHSVYLTWEELDNYKSIFYLLLIVMLVLTVCQMISLFSYTIKDGAPKIGTLRALGVPKKNISLIFILESMIATVTSLALSVIMTFISLATINNYFYFEHRYIWDVSTIVPRWWVVLITLLGEFIFAFATVSIPIDRMKKISIVNLLMGEE